MLFRKIKDSKIRKEFKKKEVLNTSLKFVYTNYFNKNKNSSKIEQFINFKQKNFSKTKVVRRCILTNRARGSIRPYNVSRVKLRELLQFGIIPGYKKSV
jgi:ribosomal protein S14